MEDRPEGVSVQSLAEQIAQLRPLPACATQIIEIMESERFSAHDLATVISSDQALTAKLLRLANSAYYGFPRRIVTARDAVVLLGFREVRSATLASCVIDSVPGSANVDYDAFWHFSLTVGMLAEILARTEGAHRDHAFTAGVLHNIGVLALDQTRPADLAQAIDVSQREGTSLWDAERRILNFTDADLGAALARRWSFPPILVEAVAEHSRPLSELPPRGSLTAFVVRARHFAHSYGLSDGLVAQESGEPPAEWTQPRLAAALGHAGGMERVIERVEAFMETATVK